MNLNEIFTTRVKLICVLIAAAALSRLLPHPSNFTPIGAMALFGGTFIINKRYAILLPLIAMFISDVILQLTTGYGFHPTLPFVYISFILITCLGFYLRKLIQRQTVMVCSLVGSLLFFLITNFGEWMIGTIGYPHTWDGLTDCYIKAIPFFGGTIMGDLFYNVILFSAYSIIKWKYPVALKS